MSDIVERLQAMRGRPAMDWTLGDIRDALDFAIAEIERLRVTLASWEAAAAMVRGAVASPGADSAPAVITDAAPNAPR